MRTNIDIDDDLMDAALAAGPYKTKKEAVEAGLQLLQRQAALRKLLALEGKLDWGWGDEPRLDGQGNVQRSATAAVTPPAAPTQRYAPAASPEPLSAREPAAKRGRR